MMTEILLIFHEYFVKTKRESFKKPRSLYDKKDSIFLARDMCLGAILRRDNMTSVN